MLWSNLWKLRKSWEIENYTASHVNMYHCDSGLASKVKLPPLLIDLMECEYARGYNKAKAEIRKALDID